MRFYVFVCCQGCFLGNSEMAGKAIRRKKEPEDVGYTCSGGRP